MNVDATKRVSCCLDGVEPPQALESCETGIGRGESCAACGRNTGEPCVGRQIAHDIWIAGSERREPVPGGTAWVDRAAVRRPLQS